MGSGIERCEKWEERKGHTIEQTTLESSDSVDNDDDNNDILIFQFSV